MNKTISRIIMGVVLLFSVFIFPWWVFVVLSALSVLFFDFYVEVVFAGFLMDLLYGGSGGGFFEWFYFFSAYASAVFLISFYIKERMNTSLFG